MKYSSKYLLTTFITITTFALHMCSTVMAGQAKIEDVSAAPYRSAIVMDAATGKILYEKDADVPVYPASTLKLMVLLIIVEQIEQGIINETDMVQVTKEAYRMGGSQVYLDPSERFSVEDLLYALMIQSANDAAVALATHVAGSKEGFVSLMNQKAKELGMNKTLFYSVHGLPPAKGQRVDVTTARDFGILCKYLSSKPVVFKYTSEKVRDFRGGKFILRTHNHLLEDFNGCDGFKTGYFSKAGFSIAATAKRGSVRIIAVVMGSKNRKERDAKAIELLAKGFTMVVPTTENSRESQAVAAPPADLAVTPEKPFSAQPQTSDAMAGDEDDNSNCWLPFLLGLVLGVIIYGSISYLLAQKRKKRNWRYK